MKTLVLAAAAVLAACLVAGCASQAGAGADGNAAIPTGSGITVFGTVDAGVGGVKNR